MKKALAALLALLMMLSLSACGGKKEDTGIAGEYTIYSATIDGTDFTLEELQSADMAEGTYLILNQDGKGELCFAGDEPDSFSYNVRSGKLTFADDEIWTFTVDGNMVTVNIDEVGMVLVFAPASDAAGSGSSAGTNSAAANSSDFFGSVTVASSINDAFAGTGSGGSGFVPETTSFELNSRWYGTLALTNFVGASNEDTYLDAYGVFGKTNSGKTYFEIYLTEDHSDDSPALSYYIDLKGDYFVPIIGKEDAWIFNTYLTAADTEQQTTYLFNGALVITYPYHDTDRDYSCDLLFYLREEGAKWDEAYDLLPPGYQDYKAEFGI